MLAALLLYIPTCRLSDLCETYCMYNTMRKTCTRIVNQATRQCSSSSTFEQNPIVKFIEKNYQVITVSSLCLGGAYYFGSQHVYHTVELISIKESLAVKEKADEKLSAEKEKAAAEKEKAAVEKEKANEKLSAEKEKANEKVFAEKEKANEKVFAEKEKALKDILSEKEKTQAAEKRELEARIRELETQIKSIRPPTS